MKKLIMTVLLGVAAPAFAGNLDAIPTCHNKFVPAPKGVGIDTELFVVIDQTTAFDASLQQSVANNIRGFLKPGYKVSVSNFSAYTQGHYTEVLVAGALDHQLTTEVRDDIPKKALKAFDACLAEQPKLAGRLVGKALKTSFTGASNDIAKSDVLGSLKDISGMVKKSTAKRKVVLLASDMLENSSVTTFYAKNAVRKIDPAKEIDLAVKNDLIGDFGGAEVYVIGTGLLPSNAKTQNVYRSPEILAGLSGFWKTWFAKSNATVQEFGQPALLTPIEP
jgi:hypothetical protein